MLAGCQNLRRRIGRRVPEPVRTRLRPIARRLGLAAKPDQWWESLRSPWDHAEVDPDVAAACNVCGWRGQSFIGPEHSEGAMCPQCGAIARDRFLLWCMCARVDAAAPHSLRVLETSPRLGHEYRQYMRSWFDYRASDFDLSSHIADIQLDLQDIRLPDDSIDVLLSPHVLEHVPDTARALAEIRRVLSAEGCLFLQVPLQFGTTHVPVTPQYHADNTLVYFNFGWDLTDTIRAAGFDVEVLLPEQFTAQLTGALAPPSPGLDDFDLVSMFSQRRTDHVVAATRRQSEQLGFQPAHQFVTWVCRPIS